MIYIIAKKGYKPMHYNPSEGIVITEDHICHFHGEMISRSQSGNKSIEEIWSTRSVHKANWPIKESMTKYAFKDLCRYMQFADDWGEEDEGWDEKYNDVREIIAQGTANHQRKFGMLNDGYNCQLQAMVNSGRSMTAN